MHPTWPDGLNTVGNIQEVTSETVATQSSTNERTPLILNGTNIPVDHAQNDQQALFSNSAYIHILFMVALSMFLIIGVGTAVYLLISEGTDWITWSTYSLVRRGDWNAEKSTNQLVAYDKDINRIMLISTKTTSCLTERQCCDIVKNLQKYHINTLKEPDIMYNFLIGNDGQIYEGSGWKTKLDMSNKNHNSTIIIALIGNSNDPILDIQLKTTKTFLDVFVDRKLINKCFTILVPYNFKVTEYYLINFASALQKYANKFCSEKLLFY